MKAEGANTIDVTSKVLGGVWWHPVFVLLEDSMVAKIYYVLLKSLQAYTVAHIIWWSSHNKDGRNIGEFLVLTMVTDKRT